MSGPGEDDLRERIAELEETLRELQAELEPGRPPRGPLGLPRPPTPREALRFTHEYAIPTTIAFLEANVRALETIQRALEFTDPERTVAESGDQLGDRVSRASRATVHQLDQALARLDDELAEGTLPSNPDARRVLEDARQLNDEIAAWLSSARTDADRSRTEVRRSEAVDIDVEEETVDVDVESEIESIKDDLDDGDDDLDGDDFGDEGSS